MRPFPRIRLLEEVGAATSKEAAAQIVEAAQPEIEQLEPHAREQLLAETADLIREKFE
jgi:acyl-CoA reductase-like NAD-dependent aldehyde dehydrogenase